METLELIEKRLTRIEQALSTLTPQATAGEKLYTREDLRRMFHISLVTVDDWTRKGIFKAHRLGSRVFYHPDEVRAVIERRG